MDEIKTKVILEAEAKGFDRAQKVVDQIVGTVGGGSSKPSVLSQLDKALAGITSSLGKLEQSVTKITKASRDLDRESKRQERQPSDQQKREARPEPNFLRGLLQGVGVGQYLPGVTPAALAAQSAGVMVGRGAAGVARGVAGSAFSGMSGITQAFGALGTGGQVAAGMGQAAIASVEDALAFEQARTEGAFAADRSGSRVAAARAAARVAAQGIDLTDANSSYNARLAEIDKPSLRRRRQGTSVEDFGIASNYGPSASERRRMAAEQFSSNVHEAEQASAAAQRRAAGAAAEQAAYGLASTGQRFGLDFTETTRASTDLARARGGLRPTDRDLGAALGAQARYGVDLGTSGAVFRGARVGAGTGKGSEGDQLAALIGQATRQGLQGSDITQYLQRIAEGVARFETTGIPLATESTDAMARTLGDSGMAHSVAAGRAAAMTASVQGRAAQGLPSSATDFAALVHLGGFSGGGPEAALEARANLIGGKFKAGGVDELTKLFAGQVNTGPRGRAFGVERGFGQLGLSLNPDEAAALEAQSSGRMSPEQKEALESARAKLERGPQNASELANEGAGIVGGGLQRQAGIRNRRIATGLTSMTAVQDFEDRAARATQSFALMIDKMRILNPVLDELVHAFERVISATTGGSVSVQSGP